MQYTLIVLPFNWDSASKVFEDKELKKSALKESLAVYTL